MAAETILIVEDERAVARGLTYGLREQGFVPLWAATGQAALALARQERPSLAVLDIRLPDMTGFDVCRQLRSEGMRLPILMLTARDDEVDKVLGLELGADDYVVKPYSLRELVSRIRALLRRAYGELALPTLPTTVSFGPVQIDFDRMQVFRHGQPVVLTPTEFRLLRVLVANAYRPCSRESLIEAVWGYDGELGSDRTVDVHIRHLRQKLEDDPAHPRWLVTVRGAGYKFEP
ncbi:MAG TPA: response regulator transcription factor [Caldilineaceae bacterium]|nr:response regulator transcription factor [Caldilineaceae bacterium]